MWGMIEMSREIAIAESLSLEQAWALWCAGSLRAVLAMAIAQKAECECGNGGVGCFNSAHGQIREMLRKGWKPDGETLHAGNVYEEFTRAMKEREALELSTNRADGVISGE